MTDAALKCEWMIEQAQEIVHEQAQILDEMRANIKRREALLAEKYCSG